MFQPTPLAMLQRPSCQYHTHPAMFLYMLYALQRASFRLYLPQNLFIFRLSTALGFILSEPKILKFVSCHQVPMPVSAFHPNMTHAASYEGYELVHAATQVRLCKIPAFGVVHAFHFLHAPQVLRHDVFAFSYEAAISIISFPRPNLSIASASREISYHHGQEGSYHVPVCTINQSLLQIANSFPTHGDSRCRPRIDLSTAR
jgi:hypothetical protein